MQKFFKIGFFVSLLLNIAAVVFFFMNNPMAIEGQHSWMDLYTNNANATTKFLDDNFGIKVTDAKKEGDFDYRLIKAEKALWPFAGVMQISESMKKSGMKPRATIYLTTKDYDKKHEQLVKNGAKAVLSHKQVENMKFGIYIIPGGLDIGVVQYNVKKK